MEELTRQACADGEGGSLQHELKFEEINGPTYLLQLDVSLIISVNNFLSRVNFIVFLLSYFVVCVLPLIILFYCFGISILFI